MLSAVISLSMITSVRRCFGALGVASSPSGVVGSREEVDVGGSDTEADAEEDDVNSIYN